MPLSQKLLVVGLFLMLSASAALADVCPPAKVVDLAVPLTGSHSVKLTFTDPGDDCNSGTAASYEIRYSASAITESNYYSATVLASGSPLGSNGTADCNATYNVSLACSTTYYFAITFMDAAGNRSPVSNSPSGTIASCSSHSIPDCP